MSHVGHAGIAEARPSTGAGAGAGIVADTSNGTDAPMT
jgi:hypothetical protein